MNRDYWALKCRQSILTWQIPFKNIARSNRNLTGKFVIDNTKLHFPLPESTDEKILNMWQQLRPFLATSFIHLSSALISDSHPQHKPNQFPTPPIYPTSPNQCYTIYMHKICENIFKLRINPNKQIDVHVCLSLNKNNVECWYTFSTGFVFFFASAFSVVLW